MLVLLKIVVECVESFHFYYVVLFVGVANGRVLLQSCQNLKSALCCSQRNCLMVLSPAQFLVKVPLQNSFGSNHALGLGLHIGKCVFMHRYCFWMCELFSNCVNFPAFIVLL